MSVSDRLWISSFGKTLFAQCSKGDHDTCPVNGHTGVMVMCCSCRCHQESA